MNIITKNIFIQISVCFEEPLQDVELVEEETIEISSRSADDSDDENGSMSSDFSYLMYDISENNISGLNQILMCPLISQNGPKRHSLPPGQTLEILLIQEELDQIFKENISCHDSLLYDYWI